MCFATKKNKKSNPSKDYEAEQREKLESNQTLSFKLIIDPFHFIMFILYHIFNYLKICISSFVWCRKCNDNQMKSSVLVLDNGLM